LSKESHRSRPAGITAPNANDYSYREIRLEESDSVVIPALVFFRCEEILFLMTTSLESFLQRHPWSETGLLMRVFDPQTLRALIRENPLRIARSEWGERWALPGEADSQALSLSRLETARAFVWWNFGRDGFFTSRSPGRQCDMEVIWKGKTWCIFVDPGGIAPEAISWIQHPPSDHDGPRVVLSDRYNLLIHWLEQCWSGGAIQIGGRFSPPWSISDHAKEPFLFSIQPRWGNRRVKSYPPPDVDQLALPLEDQDLRLARNILGRVSLFSGPWIGSALSSIGFLPFLTKQELHFLDPLLFSAAHLQFLRSKQLVQGDRMTLSASGLRMIAGFWGTDPRGLSRRHPWPLRFQRRNRCWVYSTAGAARFGAHDTQVRRFMLSLVEGARRISNPSMQVQAIPQTILGSRIQYGRQGEKTSVVMADARVTLRMFHGPQLLHECDLLIEVDRGTYSLSKLGERLEKYRDLLRDSGRRLNLVMVFPGREREENAIAMLRSLTLETWTVSEDRLVLPFSSDWWLQNPYLGAELPRESTGSYCPWRVIWNHTTTPGLLSSLLEIGQAQVSTSREATSISRVFA
jgi:hypothetical protein